MRIYVCVCVWGGGGGTCARVHACASAMHASTVLFSSKNNKAVVNHATLPIPTLALVADY